MGPSARVTALFGIRHPIVQGGMVWTSGWKLAAAVRNAGALGVLGAGSMSPEVLDEHLVRFEKATGEAAAVNLPLLYPSNEEKIRVMRDRGVRVVITSAGSPKKHAAELKKDGVTLVHVVSSSLFAKKAEDAGCDAVIAEGFEAGGHNGREETTTMVLIPLVKRAVGIPVLAAGGIATGAQIAAAFALGAEGAQVGTAFALTDEASCHPAFKARMAGLAEGATMLRLKKLAPARLADNGFSRAVAAAEDAGAGAEELTALLGKGRAKRGMFEGDLEDGELEIGQAAALVGAVRPAAEVVARLVAETEEALARLRS